MFWSLKIWGFFFLKMASFPSHFQLRPSIIQNTINLQKTHTFLSQPLQPLTKQAVFIAFCENDVEPPACLQWWEETSGCYQCPLWHHRGLVTKRMLKLLLPPSTVIIDCVCCGSELPWFQLFWTFRLNFIDLKLGSYTVTATKNITKWKKLYNKKPGQIHRYRYSENVQRLV